MSTLTLSCKATEYNGFPKVIVLLDNNILSELEIYTEIFDISIPLNQDKSQKCLQLRRHSKTNQNFLLNAEGKIIKDQTLEIVQITIDDVLIPKFFVTNNAQFEFDDRSHPGSCFIGPNGVWTFKFQTPIVEYILDQKILHESKYNQDYQFPWSYKLGPESVNTISAKIDLLIEKIATSL